MNWLDTETRAVLEKSSVKKSAPPKTREFSLVLLEKGADVARLARAICRINDCSKPQAQSLLQHTPPICLHRDLSYEDALLGQFELICCDAASVCIRSQVVENAELGYLRSLYSQLAHSSEFRHLRMRITHLPENQSGAKFADQFLGIPKAAIVSISYPLEIRVSLKKARIMQHWAGRIGARLASDEPLDLER